MKGELRPIFDSRLKHINTTCIDCNTEYYVCRNIDDTTETTCNGHTITLCPWCREDSKPWKNGRGA